jgi:predicted RNase H-like HicB family nuclease
VTESARYVKIVVWSDEDGAFVGQCPGVIDPCCHGADEVEVYRQLCETVSEWLELAIQDGTPLPPPTAGIGMPQKVTEQIAAANRGSDSGVRKT